LDINCLKSFEVEDNDIEVEYQGKLSVNTIWIQWKDFTLLNKQTALPEDACGIHKKKKIKISDIPSQTNSCTPGGGCC
jgi:hypothetical protein